MPSDAPNRRHVPVDATQRDDVLSPLVLNAKQAARALGISERLLWTLMKAGEIPHVRIAQRVVFPVRKLEAWLAERTEGGAR